MQVLALVDPDAVELLRIRSPRQSAALIRPDGSRYLARVEADPLAQGD